MTKAEELFEKFRNGTLTETERAELEQWYVQYGKSLKPEADAKVYAKRMLEMDAAFPFLNAAPKAISMWPRVIAIAAAVAAIVFGVFFFKAPRHPEGSLATRNLINDIAPGKNRATLIINKQGKMITLSDAKTGVIVNNGKLMYNDGTEINALNNTSEEQTIITPRGGTYQIVLFDGTKIWLNAASSLTYANSLNERGERRVKLSGEAYFEVSKVYASSGTAGRDGRKPERVPFIVESKGQLVKVLGTQFNIKAYDDENAVKTTLLEGSVDVNNTILQPNQQAILTGGSTIKIAEADTEEVMAWKNGYFRFNDEKIETIMTRLARWYDIEVVYEGKMSTDGFTGTASRNKNISQILSLLENTKGIHFKIEGRRVTVIR